MPRRKRNKKWISTVIILILLVIAGVVVYFVWDGYFRDKSGVDAGGDTTSEVSDKKDSSSEDSKDENVKTDSEVDPAHEQKAIQYDGGSPNELDVLTGSISYASVSGNKLLIRVSIDQYLEEGTCELALVQGGETVYQETAEIMGDATTSTCKGFDVPMTSLVSGEVQFTVYFLSGDKVGEVSGGVEI